MSIKKLGSTKLTDDVLVSSVNLASEVTGILGVANGGTGQSVFTNGQLLIGNTTGNTLTKATLTAGSGISITNGAGSISIASTVVGTQWSTNGSDIYYNGGNVGIGTASPGAKLEVTNGDIWLNATSESVNPELRFVDGAGIGVAGLKIRYGNNDGNAYFDHMWDVASSGFYFRNRVNGTPVNTLTMLNGLVGINNTSPIAPLSFANTAGNKIDLYHSTSGSGDRYGFAVEANVLRIFQGAVADATGGIVFGRSSTATFTEYARFSTGGSFMVGSSTRPSEGGTWNGTAVFGTDSYNKVIAGSLNSTTVGAYIGGHNATLTDWADLNVAGKNIIFRFDQTERMRLDGANGRLGILTSAPNVPLEVNGIARFTGTGGFSIGEDAAQNRIRTISGSRFAFYNSSDVLTGLAIRSLGVGATYGTIATPTNGAIIEGNVGIGTSSPAGPLHVLTAGVGTWGDFVVTSTSLWGDSGTQYVTIGAGGAAGIMLYNPHVVWNSGNSAAAIRLGRSGGVSTGVWYEIGTKPSDAFWISRNAGATPQFYIDSSDNIGITTATPTGRIGIAIPNYTASATAGMIRFQNPNNSADSCVQSYFVSGAGSELFIGSNAYINTSGSVSRFSTSYASSAINIRRDGDIQFLTSTSAANASTKVTITPAGDLGIGTGGPSAKLHVVGGAIADTFLYIGTTSSYNGSTFEIRKDGIWSGPVITLYQTGTGGQAWSMFSTNSSFSQGAGKLLFYNGTGAGDVAVLTPEGNMGLGVMVPVNSTNYKTLSIGGASGGQIAFHTSAGANAYIYNSSTYFDIYNGAAGSIRFYTNGLQRALFSSDNTYAFGDTDLPSAPNWPGTGVFGATGGDKVIIGRLVGGYTGACVGGHNDTLTDWADLSVDGKTNIIFRHSQTEAMRLQSGNLGIGTSSPGQRLQVNGTILANPGTSGTEYRDIMVGGINGWSSSEAHGIEAVYNTASSPLTFARFDMFYDGSSGAGSFRWGKLYKSAQGSGYVMTLTATTTTTANLSVAGTLTGTDFILSSDRRRKTELVRISDALAKVLEWAGYTYRPIDGERRRAGLMAQDVEVNAPEVVYTDDDGWKSMSYEQTIPYLVEAIRDLHRMVEALA